MVGLEQTWEEWIQINKEWIEEDIGREMTDDEMKLFKVVEKAGMTDVLQNLVNSARFRGVREGVSLNG